MDKPDPLNSNKPQGLSEEPIQESTSSESQIPPFPETPTTSSEVPQKTSGSTPVQPENVPPVGPKVTTFHPPRRFPTFKVLVTGAIVAVVVIYSVVAYLYLQNKNLKSKQSVVQAPTQPTVSPTPSFSPDQIKIQNGNVVRQIPGGQVSILVKKDDFPSTGITGFARVVVSQDNKKICIESWPPAPEPAMYIANVDGTNIFEVSPNRQNCLWVDKEGKNIIYINSAAKTSPVNIFLYDTSLKEEVDLTSSSVPEGVVRRFEAVGLSADATKLICKYEDVAANKQEPKTGQCEIDLAQKSVTIL